MENDSGFPPVGAPLEGPKSSLVSWKALVIAGIVIAAALGAYLYWVNPLSSGVATRGKPIRIGIPYVPQQNDAVLGFKEGMKALGYREGIDVEYDMVKVIVGPTLLDEFTTAVRRMIDEREDMIFASLEHVAKVAIGVSKEKGSDIPIVFLTRFHDPVTYGLITSFKSSGNNSTGVAANLLGVIERNLEFFKEMNPNFKKLGIFSDGFMAADIGDAYLAELKKQAPRFGIELVEYKTSAPPPEAEAEFRRIAATIKKGDIDGLFHIAGHFLQPQETAESELATRLGIPMAAPFEDLPNGGMFSYSDEFQSSGMQAAVLADKIFKGQKPADIPIEFGARTVLTLMLGRAREAGVTFPDSMLFIATNKFESGSDFPDIFHERE